MSEKETVAASAVARERSTLPRRVLTAFDALALHDARAADPLDGAGIELALGWEWQRAEHGLAEGIAREDLVALTEGTGTPDEEAHAGATKEEEEEAA